MNNRVVKAGELFSTFIFDGKDCANMGVYSVTSGAVYTMGIEPMFSDSKLEVPAYDGKYYYGTQITGQQFQFNCFCHDLIATEYNKLRTWLSPRKVGRLILSDQPYKYYLVKVVNISTLGAYPLTTIQTPQNSGVLGDFLEGDAVYTGSFTVTFETVGSAYGYGMSYYRDDLIYDAREKYGRDYYYNAGLLYKDMSPRATWEVEANAIEQDISMYNPGSTDGYPQYTVKHEGTFPDKSYIKIANRTLAGESDTNYTVVIDLSGCIGDVTIDMQSQILEDAEKNAYYGRFAGSSMKLSPYEQVWELPETFVQNIEDTDLLEYDSFYIENNVVSVNPLVLQVSGDMVGAYFCVMGNGGSKIQSVDVENNTLTLDPNVQTYDLLPGEVDHGVVIRPAGFGFNYVEVSNVMPVSGNDGEVCVVDGVWYLYLYGQWKETNLFNSKEDFKNTYGDYITVYRLFGATIVKIDTITITTGPTVSFKPMGAAAVSLGVDVPAFTLEGALQPRYL